MLLFFFCCKQKAAYEVRISDWSSDVCSSDLNDHRLGANEAPPAIISIFLGDQLADVFEQIAKGAATSSKDKGTMMIGARSEERRVGKARVSTCRYRERPHH